MRDLHELPKIRDSSSFLYLEQGRIERCQNAVEYLDVTGRTLIPVATLTTLLLGPGTSITHEAVKVLADNGCTVLWCGEEGVRMYAQGFGETRKAYHLIRQAELSCNPEKRMEVIMRMYRHRFGEELAPGLSLEQVRGYEGVRVRDAYAAVSRAYGVQWSGRRYDRTDWFKGDPVNRALSAANSCLNGICHAAIVSGGYSPGLGFIHTGKQLSFVYDIADLYKVEITVPLAFRLTAESTTKLEMRVRHTCRNLFAQTRLLDRILPNIDYLLGLSREENQLADEVERDPARPEQLWDYPLKIVPEEADDAGTGT